MIPGYLQLFKSNRLADRVEKALARLADCRLCPRECGVNRLTGEAGYCGIGRRAVVANYSAHFGEESPLVGDYGSGALFFAGCNLGCRLCQNDAISRHADSGTKAEPDELAGVMLDLQGQGCTNINLVTPSHVVPQILEALAIAVTHGLKVPLVFNTGAYDILQTLKLLDGVVDIYMPDIKVWGPAHAALYLQARDYPEVARMAVREMHRQVGDLRLDNRGRAEGGLLVRHLVLPENIAGTENWMEFIASVSTNTYLNIMDQYRPCADVQTLPPLDRMITSEEFEAARAMAKAHGLRRFAQRTNRFFHQFIDPPY